MYARLRPWLFRLDPELAHSASLRLLQLAGGLSPAAAWLRRRYAAPAQPVELLGLQFANRVGLAAGYDKDGLAWRGLACLGFGHIELGTVTPRPQLGNPRPRLFRLPEDEALVNRLGFPGRGAAFLARRLAGPRPPGLVLGVNLGINKDTPLEQAAADYQRLMAIFNPLADYLTINISSPNTPGLRQLQGREYLNGLLKALAPLRAKPLLVKLSPDLDAAQLDDALAAIMDNNIDGVIAANTTLARPAGLRAASAGEAGGLSGRPLASAALHMVTRIAARTQGRLPIIACGGIFNPSDARAALDAGAGLVQVYTGLVYRGPGLAGELAGGLAG
ncbi:MAG: quinone-dependent dihydroorotate dehydrogenase [Anaerolineales bacterium]|nr:quinone-dependent dihydroorotate dehydrogenase [Anaerolineales bacterium]